LRARVAFFGVFVLFFGGITHYRESTLAPPVRPPSPETTRPVGRPNASLRRGRFAHPDGAATEWNLGDAVGVWMAVGAGVERDVAGDELCEAIGVHRRDADAAGGICMYQ